MKPFLTGPRVIAFTSALAEIEPGSLFPKPEKYAAVALALIVFVPSPLIVAFVIVLANAGSVAISNKIIRRMDCLRIRNQSIPLMFGDIHLLNAAAYAIPIRRKRTPYEDKENTKRIQREYRTFRVPARS
jgi:hypothetical protein